MQNSHVALYFFELLHACNPENYFLLFGLSYTSLLPPSYIKQQSKQKIRKYLEETLPEEYEEEMQKYLNVEY
jgi:hypothetical protein